MVFLKNEMVFFKRTLLGSIVFTVSTVVSADMKSSYEAGESFAGSLKDLPKESIFEIKMTEVPGFKTDMPPQSHLDKNGNFEEAIYQSMNDSEAGKNIIENANNRQRFEIDPQTDPLFHANGEPSPEAKLGIDNVSRTIKEPEFIEKICEEGGEDITYECFENRVVVPQVPGKEVTLTVNHLSFSPHYESYSIYHDAYSWRHYDEWCRGPAWTEYKTCQNGWTTILPKELKTFREQFCKNFKPQDMKTGKLFKIDCSRIQSYEIKNATSINESNGVLTILVPESFLTITLHHDTYEGEEVDEWQSNCDAFEKMVEEELCEYGERVLTQGPETRQINGYAITKDAWQYRQVYHCKMLKDECSALRAKGCYQVRSHCKERHQEKCWIYQQQYQCPNSTLEKTKVTANGANLFCLTGDCHNTGYQANGELLDVISRLSLLKEIQNDIRAQGNQTFDIFKGQDRRCSRNCLNFKDCCGRLKGWGTSIGLAGCNEEERALAKMRDQHLCHRIGTFCSKKILGKCVSKKTTFCCFGSRLARLLQEQGRAQLGMGWGALECPDCRGLSVEQISKIDLSKVNLSEVFEDVMRKYHRPEHQGLEQKTQEKIQENLRGIQQNIQKNERTPQTGKMDENQNNF